MTPANYTYPASPKNVHPDLLEPSPEFQMEALGVVKSITTFIVTFVLLILAAIVLAAGCGYAGYWIISAIHNIWAIVIGLGLAGLGIMVLYFLFKFVFKTSTVDRANMIEITSKGHPLLFDFIKRLASETQTPHPKRVYISPDVNASVFYDSNFWSMFLPVRKNLCIGLGLVNSVNVSELKAVIAHEFGHFSQKSMKLGSYTYHVNHIIHDMLYDNRDYEETLERWGNISSVFSFFATLTGVVVEIIKEILQKMYRNINERYMAMSRQMEFHADAVAASVSGSSSLTTALYRLELSGDCYRDVLNYYHLWVGQNKKGLNVYEHHALLMSTYAEQHGLKITNGLVQIDLPSYLKLRKSRIQIKDQWASHPDTIDREKRLDELNFTTDINTNSPWILFTDPEKLQREVTASLYADVKFQHDPEVIDKKCFESIIREHLQRFSLHVAYKGFYDGRDITVFDPEIVSQQETVVAENLSDILTDVVVGLPSRIAGLTTDIEVLERIQDKSSTVKTFDFEGTKCNRADAKALVTRLKEELKHATHALEKADKDLFLLYHKKCILNGHDGSSYNELFLNQKKTAEESKLIRSMIREASRLFTSQNLTQGSWLAITNNMHREGDIIKERMRDFLSHESHMQYLTEEEKDILLRFISDKRKYFFNVGCDEEAINLHLHALQVYLQKIETKCFQHKRSVLDAQAVALL